MEQTKSRVSARERMRGIEPVRPAQPQRVEVSPWSMALLLTALGKTQQQGHRPAEVARAYHNAATKVPGFAQDVAAQVNVACVLKELYHLIAADVRAAGFEVP